VISLEAISPPGVALRGVPHIQEATPLRTLDMGVNPCVAGDIAHIYIPRVYEVHHAKM